jgi:tRNA-uridine 2-sulfurtransferase
MANVIIGLSGGVDSAVAAYLLKKEGHQLHAVMMQNWPKDDPNCPLTEDLISAKKIAEQLDIPLSVVNFSKQYQEKVFQYFLDQYAKGNTPNPDTLCNKEIKFKAFLDYALKEGADFIATGHHARIKQENDQYWLLRGVDPLKDQSYFLYELNQEQLTKSLFPIGNFEKTRVRKIAKDLGFANYNKKGSAGICFIGERKFKKFLAEYLLPKPGKIITVDNQVVGEHQGLMFYTLGQRQGLGIGGKKNFREAPWYVLEKDLKNNLLIVDQNANHPLLLGTLLKCESVNWINNEPKFPHSCTAKIRYRQTDQECVVEKINDQQLKVTFEKPQRAITPGQCVVFYQNEICLGGGIIKTTA